jgi:hypothetical protein
MTDLVTDPSPRPCEPELDENGVDLAQIREMLDRTPLERLAVATSFINSLLEIRARNGIRGAD